MIKVRQKHVLLADQSLSGWAVVQQYRKHDLAENSDDEKKILKAETRAKTKISEMKKKQRPKNKNVGYPAPSTVPNSSEQNPVPPQQPQTLVRGPCFACGKFGHLRSSCPMVQRSHSN